MSAIPSSSADFLPPPPPPPLLSTVTSTNTKATIIQNLNKIGFGYAIAIAFGFLVLISAVFLVSYVCCRSAATRRRRRHESQSDQSRNPNFSPHETSVYLPRIIFVSEDDNDEAGNVVIGLDQAVINSYPKFRFSKRFGSGVVSGVNETVCSICLCEYKESEMLRLLPDCRHYFHVTCIDPWLKLNSSCPVCRNSPLPTPLSTPLSEVVPLSQYAGGRRIRS